MKSGGMVNSGGRVKSGGIVSQGGNVKSGLAVVVMFPFPPMSFGSL